MRQVKRPDYCLGLEALVRVVTFVVSYGLNPPPITRRGRVDGDLDVCALHVGLFVRRCVGCCLDGGWSGSVAWNSKGAGTEDYDHVFKGLFEDPSRDL